MRRENPQTLIFGWRCCVVLLLSALSLSGAAQETKLNSLSVAASSPRVAVLDDGAVAVAWQGKFEGRQRIFLRLRRGGEWSEEQIVDTGEPGQHLNPRLAADGARLQLAWVNRRGRAETEDAIHYARLEGERRLLLRRHPLPPGASCDGLSLAPDGRGGARLAFQAKSGGGCSADLLEFDKEGKMKLAPLSPAATYSLQPQVFRRAPIHAVWHQSHENGFRLAGALRSADGEWQLVPLGGMLESLNAQQLPLLHEGPDGELIGLWHDLRHGVDRILLGREGDEPGEPEIVDARPEGNNWIPTAAFSETGEIAIVWVGETETGSAIFLRIHGEPDALAVTSQPGRCTLPQAAFSREGRLQIVWQTDLNRARAGDVYHTEILR